MAEFTIILRNHPLLVFLAVAVFSISLLPFLFLLLPFLISLILCSWGLARLMRGGRRRRRRPRSGSHALAEEEEGWVQWAREEFELYRQTRVNEYLEDQLKYLMPVTSKAVEDPAPELEDYGGKIQNHLPTQGMNLNQSSEADSVH